MNEINHSDVVKQQERKTKIKRLFDSWNQLDECEVCDACGGLCLRFV
ncbi:hypothetical protein [Nostoc sp. MG11]|nr:hypothetical protein [Nostoc sp. MG11]